MARSPFSLWWDAASAGYNLMSRTAETMVASAEVVSHRTGTIRAACRDPLSADYAELFGMVAEKVDAFTRANLSLLQDLGRVNADIMATVTRTLTGGGSANALAACSARLNRRSSEAAERALRPIHRRATANARRLGAKKRRAR